MGATENWKLTVYILLQVYFIESSGFLVVIQKG